MSTSLELQSLLLRLFSQLISQLTGESESSDELLTLDWVRRCKNYMDLHFSENVVAFSGMNRSYFSTEFSRHMGMPPKKYLQKKKMDKGKQLLRETRLPVTEIALSVGFPNLYSFTRAFKKYNGVSPLAYRYSVHE
jgi:AraC-like DNA-binding protein